MGQLTQISTAHQPLNFLTRDAAAPTHLCVEGVELSDEPAKKYTFYVETMLADGQWVKVKFYDTDVGDLRRESERAHESKESSFVVRNCFYSLQIPPTPSVHMLRVAVKVERNAPLVEETIRSDVLAVSDKLQLVSICVPDPNKENASCEFVPFTAVKPEGFDVSDQSTLQSIHIQKAHVSGHLWRETDIDKKFYVNRRTDRWSEAPTSESGYKWPVLKMGT